jgi:catechol 1,2-dioxygenase
MDRHIENDVVFGAVGSLVREFKSDPHHPDELHLEVELMLEPGETRIPHPPLD